MTARLFVTPGAIAGDQATVTGEQHHYLARVMRLASGDMLTLLDGQGNAYDARVTSVDKERLVASIVASRSIPLPPVAVTLYQGLPKADKFDLILQKATELGVDCIVPLAASHSVVQIGADKRDAKRARWRKIVEEAAEQCERGRVPRVEVPAQLSSVRLAAGELGLILAERDQTSSLLALLPSAAPPAIALFVGPEGGWTPAEIALLERAGAVRATLGPRILRTETAALAALALIMGRYEL